MARCPIMITVLIAALTISCGRKQGEFAFKGVLDDSYRKIDTNREFPSREEIKWVYIPARRKNRTIGVIYQKKEIVWVEIMTWSTTVTDEKPIVYGTIKDLSPGDYQIVITDVKENNLLIDSVHFSIYNDDEEDDDLL